MILIDCVYLNSEGGKKILNIFLEKLGNTNTENYFFLFDNRINKKILESQNNNTYQVINPSERNRKAYYIKKKFKIKKAICLANVPPPIKLKSSVFIYFHNDLLLSPFKSGALLSALTFFLKKMYIMLKSSNNYYWIVQTELMKTKICNSLWVNKKRILVMPIFADNPMTKNIMKVKKSFLYVCSTAKHKNLKRLIEAFNSINNIKDFNLYLHLTIGDNKYFNDNISIKNINPRLKIINHGTLSTARLESLYSESEFLIFPSLIESFGLPLIESVGFNCKVIAADLPYVDEVITPSIRFNPYSSKSIANAIDKAILSQNIPYSKLIIKNKIDKFINLINK